MSYIVFEGADFVGKSTQIELLKKDYKNAIFVNEPGFTELGKSLRKLILNENMSDDCRNFLFLADRAQLFSSLDFNKTIISDRSFISHLAYASKKDYDLLLQCNLKVMKNVLPSAVIYLYLEKEEFLKRMKNRNLDEIEKKGVEYFLKVQKNYERVLEKLNLNMIKINASEDILNINKKIKDFINDKCN